MTVSPRAINEERLDQLIGQAIVDFGAAYHAPLVAVGDKLGLYTTLAQAGPLTDEDSPAFLVGAFQSAAAAALVGPRLVRAFRTGEGLSYYDHDGDLFVG